MNNNYTIAPRVLIETYGCQMNVNDSEVVLAILSKSGYVLCKEVSLADLVLINTCAWTRLTLC